MKTHRSPCTASYNLRLPPIQPDNPVNLKGYSPCSTSDEHDVGAEENDILSLIAIDRFASSPLSVCECSYMREAGVYTG